MIFNQWPFYINEIIRMTLPVWAAHNTLFPYSTSGIVCFCSQTKCRHIISKHSKMDINHIYADVMNNSGKCTPGDSCYSPVHLWAALSLQPSVSDKPPHWSSDQKMYTAHFLVTMLDSKSGEYKKRLEWW